MSLYRRRPLEVRAVQWTGENTEEIAAFIGTGANWMLWKGVKVIALWVEKSSEVAKVKTEDWIVAEPDGVGFSKCAKDVFATTYEPAVNGALSA